MGINIPLLILFTIQTGCFLFLLGYFKREKPIISGKILAVGSYKNDILLLFI